MPAPQNFEDTFAKLKAILSKYEDTLSLTADSPGNYYLDTKHVMPHNKQPLFFGAVQIKKNYVSYYLMPVYVAPELLDSISPELKKRMQGKSCFNFKKVDEEVFRELEALTVKGYENYREKNYI